jgi:hypothetical protein
MGSAASIPDSEIKRNLLINSIRTCKDWKLNLFDFIDCLEQIQGWNAFWVETELAEGEMTDLVKAFKEVSIKSNEFSSASGKLSEAFEAYLKCLSDISVLYSEIHQTAVLLKVAEKKFKASANLKVMPVKDDNVASCSRKASSIYGSITDLQRIISEKEEEVLALKSDVLSSLFLVVLRNYRLVWKEFAYRSERIKQLLTGKGIVKYLRDLEQRAIMKSHLSVKIEQHSCITKSLVELKSITIRLLVCWDRLIEGQAGHFSDVRLLTTTSFTKEDKCKSLPISTFGFKNSNVIDRDLLQTVRFKIIALVRMANLLSEREKNAEKLICDLKIIQKGYLVDRTYEKYEIVKEKLFQLMQENRQIRIKRLGYFQLSFWQNFGECGKEIQNSLAPDLKNCKDISQTTVCSSQKYIN